jgi:hypothetical protein
MVKLMGVFEVEMEFSTSGFDAVVTQEVFRSCCSLADVLVYKMC